MSNFSKASKKRGFAVFQEILSRLKNKLKRKKGKAKATKLFPIDSTILTLTSKLLWQEGYHQVKLFCGRDSWTGEVGGILIHFGQGHDHKYGQETVEAIPGKGVGVMDRGFSLSERIKELKEQTNKRFILRIKNNMGWEILEDGKSKVDKDKRQVEIKVVIFCDVESRKEYRLATNLEEEGEGVISNEEIGEIYQQRWQIELCWKFLKMHLKLDRLMTKNENGIRIQIDSCLIAYVILQLIEIPREFGEPLLDKLRYLQAYMCQEGSYISWFRKLIWIR